MENYESNYEIMAEKTAGTYIYVKPGTYVARCITLIELGTQTDDFQGKGKTTRRKIVLGWELPEELYEFSKEKGPQPFYVNRTYSLSMHEKSGLKKTVESWLGTLKKEDIPFNVAKLLGQSCLITMVITEGETDTENPKTKVSNVTGLIKGQVCPDQVNPTTILSLNRWDQELFESQPAWIRERIESSPEYKELKKNQPLTEGSREGQWVKDDLSNL